MKIFGIVVLLLTIVVLAVSCEVSIWNECRSDHSFMYCVRVMGSR